MMIDGYRIEPLTPERFDDLVAVLGRGGAGGCWCMYWICPTSQAFTEGSRGGSTAQNRADFAAIVTAGPPPGLLLYDDDTPIAWCRVMPRSELPGLANSRFFKTGLDIEGVWSLPCFVVRREHRGRGLTSVLTRAAIEYVRSRGGRIVEAYPTEPAEPQTDAAVYTGVASTFTRLGFDVVQRTAPHKPMMRKPV